MYYKTDIKRTAEKEFLASDKVVSFTGTVVPDGVKADADGRKIVHKGSLMSASGTVVSLKSAPGTITFLGNPAGILMEPVDVTYGAQPGAFLQEGYVIGERLPLDVEYTEEVGAAIHAKLPEIKFVKKDSE